MPSIHFILPIWLITSILSSCLTTNKISDATICGQYSLRHLTTYQSLHLYEDSTFLYSWGGSLLQGETEGKWLIRANKLILNSEIQPDPKNIPPLTIVEKTTIDQDSITIQIVDQKLNPIPNGTIILKNSQTELIIDGKTVDKNGSVNIPLADSMNLLINAFPFSRVEYSLINNPYNFFVFQLKVGDNDYVFFEEEKWKYRNGKLYKPRPRRWNRYSRDMYLENTK